MTEIVCLYEKCAHNKKMHCTCEGITINEYWNCGAVEDMVLITPKSGELWKKTGEIYFVLDTLAMVNRIGIIYHKKDFIGDIRHGDNLWERIYPLTGEIK